MSDAKEADLITAVLLYAVRCLADGDQHALNEMNFGPKEMAALHELSMGDLYRARALYGHCLQIRLNREVYWPMLAYLRREREAAAVQQELIKGDAPLEMMQILCAMSPREYTRLRRLLTLNPGVGRTPEPGEATSAEVWRAWRARVADAEDSNLTPEDYLALHRETGASLRAIWTLVQRWHTCGELGEYHGPDPSARELSPYQT